MGSAVTERVVQINFMKKTILSNVASTYILAVTLCVHRDDRVRSVASDTL